MTAGFGLTWRPLPAAATLLALGLAGCTQPDTSAATPEAVPVSAAPVPRPLLAPSQADLRRARAEAARAAPAASDRSLVMAGYLQRIEASLIARGRLRLDRADATPLTAAQLTDDFIQIALRDEYTSFGSPSAGAGAPPAPLRRWMGEVRLQPVFGASVPPQVQARDRQAVSALAARLSRATGHPVRAVAEGGNFMIAITSQDDAAALVPQIAAALPGVPHQDLAVLPNLSPQIFCAVFAYGRGGGGPDYTAAIALIRAELPTRLRQGCVEEELAQGLGLPNDSDSATPSVFNDDEVYALLTRHDELLLQMLYDPRLRAGMAEAEVAPIALDIAAGLLGATAAPVPPLPATAPPAAPTLTEAATTITGTARQTTALDPAPLMVAASVPDASGALSVSPTPAVVLIPVDAAVP